MLPIKYYLVLTTIFNSFGCAGVPAAEENGRLLYKAAASGSVSDLKTLLDKGVSADERYYGQSALIVAIYYGNSDAVKLMLDRGANANTVSGMNSDRGPTALSIAAARGRSQIAKMLIAKGANIPTAIAGLDCQQHFATGQMISDDSCKDGVKLLEGLLENQDRAEPVTPHQAAPSGSVSLLPNYSSSPVIEDYAVIVGIENYVDLPAAVYSERDATVMKNFIRALGVPERNIVLLTGARATKTGMEKTLEAWLPNNVSENSRVFVYYSGHGAPDAKTGDAYLVPSDGDPQYLAQTGYPLKRLYAKLGLLKAKSVLVALDSCFSGAGGRSVLAKGTRPLVGKVDLAVQAEGKISVISASAGDQISGANDEVGYGLFTYNFLQGLNGAAKDAQGQVTLKSLYAYLKPRVQDEARRGNREQTPQLQNGGEDFILRAK